MDTNKALGLLGRPGAYSIALYCLMFAMNMFAAFNHVSLPSLYGIPIQHECLRGSKGIDASSVNNIKNNSSSGVPTQHMLQSRCFLKVGNETIKCVEWTFFYPHGITKTWINEFNLVCDDKYLISLSTSIYMAGVMLGSILIGMASDRHGRRPTLLICLFSASTLGLTMAFIPNLAVLMMIRFFLGFFIAGLHGVVIIFPTEITPKKYANIASVCILNSFIIGALLGCFVSWSIQDWRMIQIALSIPGLICGIVVYLFLPESPRWCLSSQNYLEFQRFFTKAVRFNRLKGKVLEDINLCLKQKNEPATSAIEQKRYSTIDVFRTPKIRQRSLIGIYLWFTAGISFYTLVLNVRTLSDNPFLSVLTAASSDVATYALAFIYVPWIGKRKSLVWILLTGGICCIVYKFYNSLAILLVGKALVAVSFGLIFIYLPEIYPTVIRNIGVGTLSLFARLGSLLAPQVVLLGSYTSFDVPLLIVGSLSILAGFLTIFAPETKDRIIPDTIEEIEKVEAKIQATEDVTQV